MTKKKKRLNSARYGVGIVLSIVLLIAMFFFINYLDRFYVRSSDSLLLESAVIYKTEFCASKLRDLAHEIHFLEEDIRKEKGFLESDPRISLILDEEQRELSEIHAEFDNYTDLCEQFDEEPTPQLCDKFLKEARHRLELSLASAEAHKTEGLLERFEISLDALRKNKRIYSNLLSMCSKVK